MSIRHTILGLLDWAPMHGYALRELAKSYQAVYPMPTNNIYPALKQLSEDGLITAHETEVIDGRARKIYEITLAGREELRRWLTEASDGSVVIRDPNTLKVALLRESAIADARSWLEAHRDQVLEETKKGEAYLKEQGESLPRYTRFVAQYGVDGGYLRVRFIDQLLAQIEEDLKSKLA